MVTESAPEPILLETPEPPPASEPTPRRKLSLRPRREPSPAAVAPSPSPALPAPWPHRVVFEPGKARDLTIFLAPLAGDPPREVQITDPYAAAGHRARAAVAEFVAMLVGNAAPPARTLLTTYDGESIERPPESSAEQYEQMQARWRQQFGVDAPLMHRQRSKWQAADLHDREVRVVTRSGRTLLWDLGRGIDGVMGTKFGCRVNVTEL